MSDEKKAPVSAAENMAKVGGCFVLLAAIPLHIVWSAFVTVHLWAWFVVPAFHLPPLSLAIAAGLETLVASQRGMKVKKDDDDFWTGVMKDLGRMFLVPAFFLFVGWAIQAVAL